MNRSRPPRAIADSAAIVSGAASEWRGAVLQVESATTSASHPSGLAVHDLLGDVAAQAQPAES
jgi:hypothetical protein